MADNAIVVIGIGGLLYYLYESYKDNKEGSGGPEGPGGPAADDKNIPTWYPDPNPPAFDPKLLLELGEYIVGQMIFDFLGREVMLVASRLIQARASAVSARLAIQHAGDVAAQRAIARGATPAEQAAARAAAEKGLRDQLQRRAVAKQVAQLGPKTALKWGEAILARANNGLRVLLESEAKALLKSQQLSQAATKATEALKSAIGTAGESAARIEAQAAVSRAATAAQQLERISANAAEQATKVAAQEAKIAQNAALKELEKVVEQQAGRVTEQKAGQLIGRAVEQEAGHFIGQQGGRVAVEQGGRLVGETAVREIGGAVVRTAVVRGVTRVVSTRAAASAAAAAATQAVVRREVSRATVITSKTTVKEGAKMIAEAARSSYNKRLAKYSAAATQRAAAAAVRDAKYLAKGGVLRKIAVGASRVGRGAVNLLRRLGAELMARAVGTRAAAAKMATGGVRMAGKLAAMGARAAAMLSNPITVAMALVSIAAIAIVIKLDISDEEFQHCPRPGDFEVSSLPFVVKLFIEFLPGIGDLFSIMAPMSCLRGGCEEDEDIDVMPIPGMVFAPWCFKKAHPGFTCHSFLCYADYPTFQNNGMLHTFAHATKKILMDTGTIPTSQPMINGKPGRKSGELWYEDIDTETDKWDIVAGVAWHKCPPGYKDIGAFCLDWRLRETAVLRDCPQKYDQFHGETFKEDWINDGLICREPLTSDFRLLPCAPGDRDDGLLCWGEENYDADIGNLSPDQLKQRLSKKFKEKFGDNPADWHTKKELWFNGDPPIKTPDDDTYNPDSTYKEGDTVMWNGQPFRLIKEFGGSGYSPQYWSCYRNKICEIAFANNQYLERDAVILNYNGWIDTNDQKLEGMDAFRAGGKLSLDGTVESVTLVEYPRPYGNKTILGIANDEGADKTLQLSKFSPGGWWQEVFPEVRAKEVARVNAWNAKLAEWNKTNTWNEDEEYQIGDMVRFQMDETPITVDQMLNGVAGRLPNFVCFKIPKRYKKKEKFVDIGGYKSRTNDLYDYEKSDRGIGMPPTLDQECWASPYSMFGLAARNANNTWVGQKTYNKIADDQKAKLQEEIDKKREEVRKKDVEIGETNDKIREVYNQIEHHRSDIIEKDIDKLKYRKKLYLEANDNRNYWRNISDYDLRKKNEEWERSGQELDWNWSVMKDDLYVKRKIQEIPSEITRLETRLKDMKDGGYAAKINEFQTTINEHNNRINTIKDEIKSLLADIPKLEDERNNISAIHATMYYNKGDVVVFTDRQLYVSLYSENHDVEPDSQEKIWLRISDKPGDPYAEYEMKNDLIGEGQLKYVKRKVVASSYEMAYKAKEDYTVKQNRVFDPELIYKKGDIVIFRGDQWKARRNPNYVYDSYGHKFKGMSYRPDITRLEGPDNVENYLRREAWFPMADTFNCRGMYAKGKGSVIYALQEYRMTRSLDRGMRNQFISLIKRDTGNLFCGLSPVLLPDYWEKVQFGWKGKEPHP